MTALDLAEELIVLRDLAYGLPVMAMPEYQEMTPEQIHARRVELKAILEKIEINKEPAKKVRVTAADFFEKA